MSNISFVEEQKSDYHYIFQYIWKEIVIGTCNVTKSKCIDLVLVEIPLPGEKFYFIIDEIEIIPAHRGRGIGTAFIKRIIQTLSERDESLDVVVIPVLNEYTPRLENWYKRLGFTQSKKFGYFIKSKEANSND